MGVDRLEQDAPSTVEPQDVPSSAEVTAAFGEQVYNPGVDAGVEPTILSPVKERQNQEE